MKFWTGELRAGVWMLCGPLLALLVTLGSGCSFVGGGGDGDGDGGCIVGQSVACACNDGTSGAQVCQENGRFGACSCGPGGGNGDNNGNGNNDGNNGNGDNNGNNNNGGNGNGNNNGGGDCDDSDDCGRDERCVAGLCVPQRETCSVDSDCREDQICQVGVCIDRNTPDCQLNSDCAADERCEGGNCVPDRNEGCDDDGDCPFGEICVDGDCRPRDDDCRSDSDCPFGERCEDGRCKAPSEGRCGDGEVNFGEECDDGRDNSDSLPNRCRSNCRHPRCGDGVVDAQEQCDGQNLDGRTCSSVTGNSGVLRCDRCRFDTSLCEGGGNGGGNNPPNEGNRCETHEECNDQSLLCITDTALDGGRCRVSCGGDGPSCPGSATCEPLNGGGGACIVIRSAVGEGSRCGVIQPCRSGSLCVTESSGVEAYCRRECNGDNDCSGDDMCLDLTTNAKACLPPGTVLAPSCGACTSDNDCPAGERCLNTLIFGTICTVPCTTDADCGGSASSCFPFFNGCFCPGLPIPGQ